MSTTVSMPQLGESVTEGTVTRWLKSVGDTIQADEPLLEVSTDKVDTEIPSPVSGVLLEILAAEDAVVLVGGALAVIGDASAAPMTAPAPQQIVEQPAAPPIAQPMAQPMAQPVAQTIVQPSVAPVEVAMPSAGVSSGATPLLLPALGESVTEGTVTRWLKTVGDTVAIDEPVLEVSTDKVDTEIPSPVAGILLEISVPEDGVVAVGGQLGLIGSAASVSAPSAPVAAPAPAVSTPAPPAAMPPISAPTPSENQEFQAPTMTMQEYATLSNSDAYATPLVRKLAAERGVDLSRVSGTGVGGRIRKEDILATTPTLTPVSISNRPTSVPAGRHSADAPATPVVQTPVAVAPVVQAATAPAPVPAPASPASTPQTTAAPADVRGTTAPLTRLRKVIAERMVESLQISAQLTSVVEVDVTAISELRNRVKADFEARAGVKLSFLPFFAKASCEALKEFPTVNAQIDQAAGTVTYFNAEHLGVAVDTERGLLVPVVRDAGSMSIAGLSQKISDLAERTRTNKLSPDELSGGTFTITNTGSRGALFDTPIINQPQVAILGTGAVVKRPVVVKDASGNDVIAIRQMVYLAMTYDHRLVDGADAARFLSFLKARLEEGKFENDLGI